MGFFDKIKKGLSKTRDSIMGGVDNVLKSFVKVDEELFEELELSLIHIFSAEVSRRSRGRRCSSICGRGRSWFGGLG